VNVPWLGEATWFGPDGVSSALDERASDVAVVTIAADRDLAGVATGSFTELVAGWRFDPPGVEGLRVMGFGLCEFGLPARADDRLQRWAPLLPHRPASVLPVLLALDDEVVLLAPLDGAHEQCFAADGNGPAWGWHGDLDEIPAGFSSSLAVIRARGARAALDRWGELLGAAPPKVRRYRDALGRMPSYWTDNGAAYWYRTEPGHTVTSGIAATVADLEERGLPIGAVQLDSWWYPHEVVRPFDTDEWIVPPTGLVRWEPRDDVFPDGMPSFDGRPLVTHCRHLSAASPYVTELHCWVDGERAHPATPALYERWMDQALAWGVETFEHDWLVECFTGVRPLRARARRTADWQRGVHDAAVERGLTLQWCMATPADMALAASLPAITSVRTSGDTGYLVGPGFLWGWFLLVNGLARSLGLVPFKDVFLSGGDHAEVESLLSSLSAGPVGIGDRLGAGDASVVAPCHRADGRLVKPDAPVAAVDRCYTTSWPLGRTPRLLVGETFTCHTAGTWRYVVALNPSSDEPVSGVVTRDELGDGVVWDWRARQFVDAGDGWSLDLPPLGWAYAVAAPVVDGVAVVGDPHLFVTAGDARIGDVDGRRVTVVGAPGETVELVGWSTAGEWRRTVDVPSRGWTSVEV
jgi:hypothetical protein